MGLGLKFSLLLTRLPNFSAIYTLRWDPWASKKTCALIGYPREQNVFSFDSLVDCPKKKTKRLQNRIMNHEINNDTRLSVSSSTSSYSASSILLVLPSAPFCYTLVGQITFSQELRWEQNKLRRTHCSEWDKRVLTIDTNRNNLRHETKEWKKYRSYSLVTKAGWEGREGKP